LIQFRQSQVEDLKDQSSTRQHLIKARDNLSSLARTNAMNDSGKFSGFPTSISMANNEEMRQNS
jgi:hypothetical protein